MAFIFVTLLIDVLGFGIVIPVLPGLIQKMSSSPEAGDHNYGLLLSVFGLLQFLFAPVLGNLSDRFGRRPVLLVSLFFAGVEYILMALAPNLAWLFVGRILTGITGASFTAASAYIADVSPPEKRAQNFGMIGAAFGVGFIIGPALGGLLGAVNARLPFWGAAVFALVNGVYGLFVLPESLAPENRRPFELTRANPFGALKVLAMHGWVLLLACAMGLLGLAQQSLQSTWVLFTEYRFHWDRLANGLDLAVLGACSIFVQMVLIRALMARMNERRLVLFGFAFNIVGFLAFGLVPYGWMLVVAQMVWSLSFVSGPAIQSLVSHQYGANEQGAVQGALTSVQSLTGVVGPLIATWVFGYFTSPRAPVVVPGAAFLLGALLAVFATGFSLAAMRKLRAASA